MRKFWLLSLAIGIGFVASEAFGQYPGGYDNYGPSAYPVNTQSILQNAPQVPASYVPHQTSTPYQQTPYQQTRTPYQTVATQEQIYGVGQNMIQQSVPTVPPAPAYTAPQPQHSAPIEPMPQIQSHVPQTHVPSPQTYMPAQVPPQMDTSCQSCNQGTMPSAPAVNQGAVTYGPSTSYGYVPTTTCSTPSPAPARTAISKPWFFGANALFLNRIDDKGVPLSFFDSTYAPDVLTTRDARMGVAPGVEIMGGRYFNCGRNAIQLSYWGVYPNDADAVRARPTGGDYRSRNPYNYVTMAGTPAAPGTPYPVYDWYDEAFTHRVSRSAEYHNFEVNLLGFAAGGAARNFNRSTAGSFFSGTRKKKGCGYCGGAGCGSCSSSCDPCGSACATSCGSCSTCAPTKFATGPCCLIPPTCGSRVNLTWLAGFRYFRFNDNFLYAASLDDSNVNRAQDDLYYEVNTTNDLVGFQTGGRFDYCLGKNLNLYGFTKVGIYNNQANLYTRIGTDFANAYLDDTRAPANPNNGADYYFDETKNNVAFLSEIGTGLGYRISCKWTATFGYRAVIVNGVATSVGNYRESFANYEDVRNFDNYGTLILHGFNVGAVYNF